MPVSPQLRNFVNELRALLERHEAVIIGTVDPEDNVLLEVSVGKQTAIFLNYIDSESQAGMFHGIT